MTKPKAKSKTKSETLESKRSRRKGPELLDPEEKRTHTVSVRLNKAELELLDSSRSGPQMLRGEYLRAASFYKIPPSIPEINREAWVALARSSANLNQIAQRINKNDLPGVTELRQTLEDFRRSLLVSKAIFQEKQIEGKENESKN
jgi:hypothetical protein